MGSLQRFWIAGPLVALGLVAATSALWGVREAVVVAAVVCATATTFVLTESWAVEQRSKAVAVGVAIVSAATLAAYLLPLPRVTGATPQGTVALRGADLSGARLAGAQLRGVDLTGANLTNANLQGADLRSTCLRGTIFTGAIVVGMQVEGADATNAIDLPKPMASGAQATADICP